MFDVFVKRPILSSAIAALILLAGIASIFTLPIAEYPQITPPQVVVTSTYIGADSQTVESAVTTPLEEEINGVQGMSYISSTSSDAGVSTITITFDPSRNIDSAAVDVQNRVQDAEGELPTSVTQAGIGITKTAGGFVMAIAFTAKNKAETLLDLSNYLDTNVVDPLQRINGVSSVTVFGERKYAMRIWLDPNKLYKYAITVGDITTAIAAQNIQVSSGELGGLPASKGQRLDATIIGPSRYETVGEFENILLKVNQNGSQVLLKDVARIELGAQSYSESSKYNNAPAGGLALKLAAGANQLTTEDAVRKELASLQRFFPPGLQIVYPLDTEPFITLSIQEVVKTLGEAIVLVFVVMYIFLQNFRATLIPTIAVPVVLLGTFGVLAVLGYSINTLTMLAMVLAVGLLVDDAIVVVENVERVMEEDRLSPRDATRKSMTQISGALIGIALYVRLNIDETPVFVEEKARNSFRQAPLSEVLRLQRREILLAAGSILGGMTFSYMGHTYFTAYAHNHLGYTRTFIWSVGALGGLASITFVMLSASLCDRVGRRRMMMLGWAGCVLWSFVVVPLMDTRNHLLYAVAIVGMFAINGIGSGPTGAFIPELFATRYRYTGAALAVNLAGIFGGAAPPLVAATLLTTCGSWSIGLMLGVLTFTSLVCTYLLPETMGTALRTTHGGHIRDSPAQA